MKVKAFALLIFFALLLPVSSALAQEPCTADFDCNGNVDADDVTVFLNQFGRSPYNNPCPDCYDSPCPCSSQGGTCPYGMTDCGDKCVDPMTDREYCGVNEECIGGTVCGNDEICVSGVCESYSTACDPPAPVQITGQFTSYATGDDGDLGKGVPWSDPRFTDNLDGAVIDNLTGLIWLKDANCFGIRTWDEALSYCNGLADGSCGLTDGSSAGDWRLPNRRELFSLIHIQYFGPAIPNTRGIDQWSEGDPFNSVRSALYWSSSTYITSEFSAFYVNMFNATVGQRGKLDQNYVWPVRGGQ